VGIPFGEKFHEGAIYRLRTVPSNSVDFPYLIVSENLDEPADILTIKDFRKVRKELKKKLKKGIGLEITLNPVRKMDGVCVGKWFSNLTELYNLCHWSRCQFIISSGATSKYEMISGPCLDAILKTIGIEPQNYWGNLTKWLEERLARNVYYAKEAK
jgi:RNase P/RNase MRP subunit p30